MTEEEQTNAITTLQSAVSTLQSQVSTLQSQVSTLQTNVSTNTADITKNNTILNRKVGNLTVTVSRSGNPEQGIARE